MDGQLGLAHPLPSLLPGKGGAPVRLGIRSALYPKSFLPHYSFQKRSFLPQMTVIHTIWESIPYQFFFESDDVFHSFVCLLIYYQGRVGHVSFFLNESDRRAAEYIKKKK